MVCRCPSLCPRCNVAHPWALGSPGTLAVTAWGELPPHPGTWEDGDSYGHPLSVFLEGPRCQAVFVKSAF